MREQSRHLEYFEYYYNLGEDRTLVAVADHFGISRATVQNCYKNLNWSDRVYKRDLEVYKELQDKNNEDIVDSLEQYRKVIKASIAEYIKKLRDGKVKINSVRDFVKLVELELKICGFEKQLDDNKLTDLVDDASITFTFKAGNIDENSESE